MTNQFWAAEVTGGVWRPAVTAGDAAGEAAGALRGERRWVSPAAPERGTRSGGARAGALRKSNFSFFCGGRGQARLRLSVLPPGTARG